MDLPVTYERQNGVGLITLDDGKLNIMSPEMLSHIHEALDLAEKEAQSVLIQGRESIFSAGFDLKVFASSPERSLEMLLSGARLVQRLLRFKRPVVSLCTGDAFPMGAFLIMSTDYRIGCDATYQLGMNETAIGITVPAFAVELARFRLNPGYFSRVVNNAEMLSPSQALNAGLIDSLEDPEFAFHKALQKAESLTKLNARAFKETKLKSHASINNAIEQCIETELTLENLLAQQNIKGPLFK
ncbi:MAG: crotonase/enoyl-CoA hydratase family protein [Pseudomonadales bacterium]|nr:crotonase/enoyl-CoA hydratase family protein [Pseudomonadales bacterium]